MVYFVGAGTGAADLITVRGMHLLEKADVIIYAGSLVNPELLQYAKKDCEIHNSARLTLPEVLAIMEEAEKDGKVIVRLHTGDPSIYGAVREQMDALEEKGIAYESCPGVSACFGAAASLNLEYTLPDISQTLIITRMEGRTGVPEKEQIEGLATHQASMAIYLSAGMLEELSRRLIKGGYRRETPAALVYKSRLMSVRWKPYRLLQRSMESIRQHWCLSGMQSRISITGSPDSMRRIFRRNSGKQRKHKNEGKYYQLYAKRNRTVLKNQKGIFRGDRGGTLPLYEVFPCGKEFDRKKTYRKESCRKRTLLCGTATYGMDR